MKINDIKLFIKIVELGSFTAAAQALDIPRGKVSRKVNEIENYLDVKLFHRTTRSLSLTNSGQTYYYEAVKALDILDSAKQQIHPGNNQVQGKIRIGLLPETHEFVQPTLFEFHDRYPEVELDIRIITNGFTDMIQQGLDIAFHSGALIESNIVAKKLIVLDRYIVASPEYIQKFGSPTTIDELRTHNCLLYRWPSGQIDNQWQLTNLTAPLTSSVICNSIGVIKAAAIAGRGIISLPKMAIAKELLNGKLVPLLTDEPAGIEYGWLLYPPPSTLNHASRVLIDWLKFELPKLN